MYCTKNRFLILVFCGTHNKPHGERGLDKHYHTSFDTKLGHGTCEIYCTPCEFVKCTYTLENPCNPGLTTHQQPHYQPVKYFTY